MIAKLLFVFLSFFLLTACPDSSEKSANVSPNQVIRSYSVDYDDAKKEMNYSAQFFKSSLSGSTIRLSNNDLIQVGNKLSLTYDSEFAEANSLYLATEKKRSWTPEVQFSFSKDGEQAIIDTVPLAGRISHDLSDTTTALVNEDLTRSFGGDYFLNDEKVEIYFQDKAGRKFYCEEKNIVDTEFTFPSKQLRFIRNNRARGSELKLYIRRVIEKSVPSADPEKYGALHYTSSFTIKPIDFIIY